MDKKEYIEKLTNLIINKVKYHSPNVNTNLIDFALISAVGINPSYPIFIFKKELDNIFYKAFLKAKKIVDFNLILFKKPKVSDRKILKLNRTFVMLENEIGSSLFYSLDALNINYVTHSDYENKLEGEYIKINGHTIQFDYYPYYFYKKIMIDGVIVEIKQFLLNGKNFLINFVNTHRTNKKVNFEINLPLPRGYYYFKKSIDSVEIENLTSKQKAYFNYRFKDAIINFSTMNGIESCTFACVNLKGEIKLLPKQTKKYYYNYGDKKYCLYSPKEMEYFFKISQHKMNEIFDIKITSHNKQFDDNINFYLPQKIWEKWQNFDVDEEKENEWLKLRKNIVTKNEFGEQINKALQGLKEVKFYRNSRWKRVFILHNNSCYLFADKIKYYNFTLLTKEIFDKNNEIYLSFAS